MLQIQAIFYNITGLNYMLYPFRHNTEARQVYHFYHLIAQMWLFLLTIL